MGRIIKSLWFVSLVGVFGMLMFAYAGLPDIVQYADSSEVTRDFFFYTALIILGISNFSLYGIAQRFRKQSNVMATTVEAWLYSFNLLLNFFYSVVLMFINMFNSGESLQYQYYGYYIYVSLGLIVICIFSLPVLIAKNINKQ